MIRSFINAILSGPLSSVKPTCTDGGSYLISTFKRVYSSLVVNLIVEIEIAAQQKDSSDGFKMKFCGGGL